ncbi:MAG: tetratricopeptide repeat protein [Bacteroidales bacterium]|jgi:tetratricopeptide (TPR) repeat protein|nr:tetratricopeptide repeat protein [Bacteroidales bacterium]
MLLFINVVLIGQNSDSQLAIRYFQNKEFDKAAVLYEKLYQETGYKNNRDYYLRSLFELKEFKTAESFLKKEIRKNSNDFYLKIDLGMVYYNQNRLKEADKEFNEVVDIVKKNRNNIISTAITFINYRQFEYAEKTYLEGAKSLNTSFDMDLANLYYYQRDYQKMMNYYLKYLETNPNAISQIQSRLQYVMANDIDESIDGIIERTLIDKIQQNPQNQSFNHLLIWQYVQTGRYKLALNQLIALDKRTSSNDIDILEFAVTLNNNNEYELAMEALQYLINKGPEQRIYNSAYIEYLNVMYSKITSELSPDKEELEKLESMFIQALNLVLRKDSYKIIYSLANLKAFYLNKYDEAIELITNSLNDKLFVKNDEAEIKLLLGDIYFLNNNQWDATLLYAQVEKAAPESTIGHEARFRKARLAYYIGQFEWAQAQLDVLKSSTSKLIANDALELSMFISENYNLDTTEVTMQAFARADFYIFSKQYTKALNTLDSIINLYPNHSLIDDALYRKANIYEVTGNIQMASELYEQIVTKYYYDILADNSLFRYALMQEKLKNFKNAEDAYFKLITEYPSSIFTVEARSNLRSLGQRLPQKNNSPGEVNEKSSEQKFFLNEH